MGGRMDSLMNGKSDIGAVVFVLLGRLSPLVL